MENKVQALLLKVWPVVVLLFVFSGCGKKPDQPVTAQGRATKLNKDLENAEERMALVELIHELQVAGAKAPEDMDLKYRLAEAFMNADRYQESAEVFALISVMNPSDDRIEYAKYNEILARFQQACTVDVDCDATDLNVTLELCSKYLSDVGMNLYNDNVESLEAKCQGKLLDKTIATFNYYLRTERIDAAKATLEKIKSKFLANNEGVKPRVLYLECKLAKYSKQQDGTEVNLSCLLAEYPDSEYTKMAVSLQSQHLLMTKAEVILGV